MLPSPPVGVLGPRRMLEPVMRPVAVMSPLTVEARQRHGLRDGEVPSTWRVWTPERANITSPSAFHRYCPDLEDGAPE